VRDGGRETRCILARHHRAVLEADEPAGVVLDVLRFSGHQCISHKPVREPSSESLASLPGDSAGACWLRQLQHHGGRIYSDISIDLPYPRKPQDPKVALKQAEILGLFEDMEAEFRPARSEAE
jgi:hypothetical protein